MTIDEINRLEPNGSTALHAASYRGHAKIVELLLQAGAWRSIKNLYQLKPVQEAKTEEIKQLFQRRDISNRFLGGSGTDDEWLRVGEEADVNAAIYRDGLKSESIESDLVNILERIRRSYIETELAQEEKIHEVDSYLDKAAAEKNPEYLIRAYTAQTGFYSALNRHLATSTISTDKVTPSREARCFIVAIITHHPSLEKYVYIGQTYRGMKITDDNLHQYKIGSLIMTKSFSSSSKKEKVAHKFLEGSYRPNEEHTSFIKFSAICIYNIRNPRTGLDISQLSEYEEEEEVLIVPYSAFRVVNIKLDPNAHGGKGIRARIELEECEACLPYSW
jgi:hypothetical protein